MTKICHMTSAHRSLDERIFYKECVSLAKEGYEVYIVAEGESFVRDGVNIIGIGESPTSKIERIIKTAKVVYKMALKIDADIYHFHDPELLPYGLKLKKKRKKVIFDSHEDVPMQIIEKDWIPLVFRKTISKIIQEYEKYVVKKLDFVITVTPLIVKKFESYNVKTEMISNFPINESNAYDGETYHEKHYICFAGGISEQWMHENVLLAIENININYILLGDGSSEYINKLKGFPQWKKVKYVGKVPHSEVINYLKPSIAGIALNDYKANVGYKEGSLGNTKLFEYMKAGIPVICTDFITWKNIINTYQCGICVNPNNIYEISNAILYLINHKEEASQMGKNGKRAVTERYNWDNENRKLIALYKNLVSS